MKHHFLILGSFILLIYRASPTYASYQARDANTNRQLTKQELDQITVQEHTKYETAQEKGQKTDLISVEKASNKTKKNDAGNQKKSLGGWFRSFFSKKSIDKDSDLYKGFEILCALKGKDFPGAGPGLPTALQNLVFSYAQELTPEICWVFGSRFADESITDCFFLAPNSKGACDLVAATEENIYMSGRSNSSFTPGNVESIILIDSFQEGKNQYLIVENKDYYFHNSRCINIWNCDTCVLENSFDADCFARQAVKNSTYLFFGQDNSLTIVDWTRRLQLKKLVSDSHKIIKLASHLEGDTLSIIGGLNNGTICIWDFETGKIIRKFRCAHSDVASFTSLYTHTNNNGDWYIIATTNNHDYSGYILNGKTGELEHVLKQADQFFKGTHKVVLPNGDWYLITRHYNHGKKMWDSIQIWNGETGTVDYTLSGVNAHITCITAAILANGDCYIYAGTENGTLYCWNMKTQQLVSTLKEHTKDINKIIANQNGWPLVTASNDNTLKFWQYMPGNFEKSLQEKQKKNVKKPSIYTMNY